MHDLGEVNSVYVHEVPYDLIRHGVCNYLPEFFLGLVKANNYSFVTDVIANPGSHHVFSSYRKILEKDFISYEAFRSLPGLISTYYTYTRYKPVTVFFAEEYYTLRIDTENINYYDAGIEFCSSIFQDNIIVQECILEYVKAVTEKYGNVFM